ERPRRRLPAAAVLHRVSGRAPVVRQAAAVASDPRQPTSTTSGTTMRSTVDLPVPRYSEVTRPEGSGAAAPAPSPPGRCDGSRAIRSTATCWTPPRRAWLLPPKLGFGHLHGQG